MSSAANNVSLKKLAQTFELLDLEKQKVAAKWLEGVIVSQILTSQERENIVIASNEYTESLTDDDYESKIDDLIAYLRKLQKSRRNLSGMKRGKG
jgi:uncharacterized protein YeeX (DUF496 family)